jgi:hypothetical protein
MNDATPEIEERVRKMMMERSPQERMRMAADMFESARALIIASLPKDLPPEELKRQLFQRIYGYPFPF